MNKMFVKRYFLVAILCGATSYVKIEMFGKSRKEWFSKYLKLENGIPDALTYRRILMMISPEKMHDIFTEWMKTIVCNLKGVVAIDGKQARRTGDDTKKPLHVVSAFAHEFGVVLGQIACEEKSNEITAIPKLLDMPEISGCIVTIDAMGTQKEIAEKIVSKNADYILSLKENQKTMYNEVKLFLDDIRNDEDVVKSPQYHKTVDKGHGRIEVRECVISYETGWLSKKSEWKGLNGIGAVYATIEENGKKLRTVTLLYFQL